MIEELNRIYQTEILGYITDQFLHPVRLIFTIIDLLIVIFIVYKAFQILKETRAGQLMKGIAFLVIITFLSRILRLNILNTVLSNIMNYGVVMLMIVFQPELRRGLEQLRNK